MGSCLSKKSACASSSSSSPPVSLPTPPEKPKSESQLEKKKTEEENIVRKDIFIIKHRKSHEIEEKGESEKGTNVIPSDGGAPVRTSSCTKEEVDAILIQCGRLSRSSSAAENGGRKYSGSKRSYDFDGEGGNGDAAARERENRRRTPSREREREQQQRSGSRERGGGRRVSRSPGRRSESPNSSGAVNANPSRPGKMVSVPATVGEGNAVKRIQVKRNVSPRARSPAARVRASNENQQQQPMSLSRSNSRKAEQSPYRRNPLAEIDTNIISQKPNADNKTVQVVSENRNNNLAATNVNSKNHQEQQQPIVPEETTYGIIQSHVGLNVISSSGQPLTRSRSSRLSRDLDINPETLTSNPNNNNNNNTSSSYTALLLEDIHNFHQKNNNTPPPPAFTLPPCVTKACSILEAVADLNSSTGSNLSSAPKKTKPEAKDPILESEVAANDDLTEPSFHKYVTVRRGTSGGEDDDDVEEQESSGSNSFAGSQQHWVSSSCWEPNSAESTDRWTSSSSSSRPAAKQGVVDESGKKMSGAKKNGIGRGRMGTRSFKNMAVST
ncbi:uncharacterized protein at1g65710 [Phtheirospermum japonicum]|uniref:Uncharacterized protein at1g65710 n=1 Tax=Phtheirospermum japonicum TaxID=374723 RepID=A0A830DGM0_9LAMI|nr:uncharacterized protein at1g65710 [Phtheirospermum japonicum]